MSVTWFQLYGDYMAGLLYSERPCVPFALTRESLRCSICLGFFSFSRTQMSVLLYGKDRPRKDTKSAEEDERYVSRKCLFVSSILPRWESKPYP